MSSKQTPSYRERRGQFPAPEPIAHKRIMLYGLTANPPTGNGGHRGIVKHIAKLQICDEIWVLPVYRHIYGSKASAVDFDHRLRMCELNFTFSARLNEHGQLERMTPVIVLDLEKTLHEQEADPWLQTTEPKSLGTIDLVLALQARFPDTHFSFLLGSDAFSDLLQGKWKESEQLLQLLDFHVAARAGYEIEGKHKMLAPPHCNIHVIPRLTDISSTYVRMHTTRQRARKELHPAVFNYIRENKLFGFSPAGQTSTLVWATATVIGTIGALIYSLWGYRSSRQSITADIATVVDGHEANVKSGVGKVGSWVKNLLDHKKH